jgi:hypothetical protein
VVILTVNKRLKNTAIKIQLARVILTLKRRSNGGVLKTPVIKETPLIQETGGLKSQTGPKRLH